MRIRSTMLSSNILQNKTVGVSKKVFDLLNVEYVTIMQYPLLTLSGIVSSCKLVYLDDLNDNICALSSDIASIIGMDSFGDVIIMSLEKQVLFDHMTTIGNYIENYQLKQIAEEFKDYAKRYDISM